MVMLSDHTCMILCIYTDNIVLNKLKKTNYVYMYNLFNCAVQIEYTLSHTRYSYTDNLMV